MRDKLLAASVLAMGFIYALDTHAQSLDMNNPAYVDTVTNSYYYRDAVTGYYYDQTNGYYYDPGAGLFYRSDAATGPVSQTPAPYSLTPAVPPDYRGSAQNYYIQPTMPMQTYIPMPTVTIPVDGTQADESYREHGRRQRALEEDRQQQRLLDETRYQAMEAQRRAADAQLATEEVRRRAYEEQRASEARRREQQVVRDEARRHEAAEQQQQVAVEAQRQAAEQQQRQNQQSCLNRSGNNPAPRCR